jgi:hypothetical protein
MNNGDFFITVYELEDVCDYNTTTTKREKYQFLNLGNEKSRLQTSFHLP